MKKVLMLIHYTPFSSRVALMDRRGEILQESTQDSAPTLGQQETHEFNPVESIYNVRAAINQVLIQSKIESKAIEGVCITTSGDACLGWEKTTGLPLTAGYTFANRQNQLLFHKLIQARLDEPFSESTGLPLSPFVPAMTLRKLVEDHPEVFETSKRKNVCVGLLESWLIYNLSGRETIATEMTHAASTGLFSLETQQWDPFLVEEFKLSPTLLPPIRQTAGPFAYTKGFLSLPDGLPILSVCHEEIALYMGFQMNRFGDCILSLEDDGCLVINSGVTRRKVSNDSQALLYPSAEEPRYGLKVPIKFPKGLLSLFLKNAPLEDIGSVVSSINTYKTSEASLYLVPSDSRPNTFSLHGLSEHSTADHLVQAYIEAIGHLIKQKFDQLNETLGYAPKEVRVLGGLSSHDSFLQFLSDMLQLRVLRLDPKAGRDWGIATLASRHLEAGDKDKTFSKPLKIEKQFVPHLDPISGHAQYTQWRSQTN